MFGYKTMLIGVFWLAAVCTAQAQESARERASGAVTSSVGTTTPAVYGATFAPASSAPPSGKGLIIAGWVMFGIGALNAAQIPFCDVDDDFWGSKRRCVGVAAGLTAAAIGLTIPMLVGGYRRRAEHRRWHDSHGLVALLSDLRIAIHPQQSALSYTRSF